MAEGNWGGIIKANSVRALTAEPVPHEPCHSTAGAGPIIELHREGDVVRAIEVTCACGNTTVIECRYEPATGEETP